MGQNRLQGQSLQTDGKKQAITPKRSRDGVMNEIVAPWKVRLRQSKDAHAELEH